MSFWRDITAPIRSSAHLFSRASQAIGLDKLVRGLPGREKDVRNLAPYAGATLGAVIGGPLGAAAGYSLGSGAKTGHASDIYSRRTLKGAALAGAGTYAGGLVGGAGTPASPAASGEFGAISGDVAASGWTPAAASAAEWLPGAATTGIDLGIAANAPGLTSSPQLTATGVSGSGLPTTAIPTSGAFPGNLGPALESEAGGSDLSGISGAGAVDAGTRGATVSAKSIAEKAASSPFSKFASKYGLPLGVLATQLLGRPKIPEMGALQGRAAAMEAAGTQDIANARAGNVTPSQRAGIDKFKSDQMSSVKQFLANSGQSADSSTFLQLKANVDQQALAMENGFLDQLMSQGLNELGLADSAEAQLINLRLQREQETSAAFGNFMMTFGLLNGWGGMKNG